MKEVKLSNIQLGMLALGFLYGSTAIVNPASAAKRDAWIAVLLGWAIGAILILMVLYISKINKGKTLSEILVSCFGKIFGKILLGFFIIFFLYKATINTRAFGEFMATVSYPETPLIVLMGVFILGAIYVARCGLACMGRVSEILVPLIPFPILVVASSMITMKNYSGFQPVLLEVMPIIKSAASYIATLSGDFIVFLMLLPYTNKEKGRAKASMIAYIGVGVLSMIIVVRNLKVIGPVLIENVSYASHIAAQLIPGVSIDPLIDINLLLGGGLKVALFLYAAVKGTAELFGIKDNKLLTCPIAVFIVVCSFWIVPNAIELRRWNGSLGLILLTIPFQVILPILMLIISLIKRPKESKCP